MLSSGLQDLDYLKNKKTNIVSYFLLIAETWKPDVGLLCNNPYLDRGLCLSLPD